MSWHFQIVDNMSQSVSLDLDSNNNPHIAYFDLTNGDLKYAYYG